MLQPFCLAVLLPLQTKEKTLITEGQHAEKDKKASGIKQRIPHRRKQKQHQHGGVIQTVNGQPGNIKFHIHDLPLDQQIGQGAGYWHQSDQHILGGDQSTAPKQFWQGIQQDIRHQAGEYADKQQEQLVLFDPVEFFPIESCNSGHEQQCEDKHDVQ
ncbi:hypothetical protein D3C73_1216110 [compost metagenome]